MRIHRGRSVRAAAPAVLLALLLTSCSYGSEEVAMDPTGYQTGNGDGKPFDTTVVTTGLLDSFTTPATVLGSDLQQDKGKPVAIEVELQSLKEGSVDDFDFESQRDERRTAKAGRVYYLSWRIAYVNGPVLEHPNFPQFELAADGESLDSPFSWVLTGSGFDACVMSASVEKFGTGVSMEGCTYL